MIKRNWCLICERIRWTRIWPLARIQGQKTDGNFCKICESAFPVQISTMILDLSDKLQLKQLEAQIRKTHDLEILINCAGYGINKDFLAEDIQKREDMLTVHDIAAMRLSYPSIENNEK